MSENLWERFDSIVTADEVAEVKSQFTPLDAGTYQVVLESIEAGQSTQGLPMIKGKFRTAENRVIFYNQMLQNINYPNMTAVNVAEAVAFISGVVDEEIVFEGLGKFANLISNIECGKSYTVELNYAKKDLEMKFPKLSKIKLISAGYDSDPTGDDQPF